MTEKEWQGKTGGGDWGHAGLRLFFKLFDVRVGYLLLYLIVPFFFLFARRRAACIYHYFRQRQHQGWLQSAHLTFRNHVAFGELLLDRFAIYAGQGKKYSFHVTGQQYWDAANRSEKGCIVVGAHIGNFEIAGYLLGKPEKKMSCVIYGHEARMMQQYRSRSFGSNNIDLIAIEDDLSHVFLMNEALQRHEIISMMSDRAVSDHKVAEHLFMGARARFPEGAFYIAERHGANMLSVFVMREHGLNYHIYIRPLTIPEGTEGQHERIDALFAQYVDEMERMLSLYPEQWYNFYDFWEE
jgi:predicted LPLAT superfamily acyltransferase